MKHVLYFTKRIQAFSGRILYLNLIAMIFISLIEGAGIFLLVPLISLTGFLELDIPENSFLSGLYTFFQEIPPSLSLFVILGIYVLLIIGQSYFQRSQTILNTKIQQSFTRHLREETYKAFLQANWSFFLGKRKTDLINIMTAEIARVSGGTQLFLQFASSFIFTFIQIGIALWLSVKMTIFVLVFGAILMFFSRKFIKKSSDLGGNTIEISKAFLAGMTDSFNGIKEIKSNNLEDSHINWFHSLNQRMEDNMVEMVKLKTKSQLIYKIASAFIMVTFIYFSIKLFQTEPAQLMLIIIIFSRLWPRFSGIQSTMEQLGTIIPSFKMLVDIQNECLKEKEINDEQSTDSSTYSIKQEIACQDVSFRYDTNQSNYALEEINIKIPVNHMTAVVGPSGAGKSTLIDLLMGLNIPEKGNVLIDGTPLTKEKLLSFRRSMSYVPQDPFLFNATLRENLLMIDPTASDAQIWEALEFSSAAEFVKKLPQGLDTLIGDRGIRLSGGERQRIVLARAILRKPSILVLDEATSALDTENERKIQHAIEQLKGKMTIIVIAHRLSTISNADQVIVLDNGKIIQKGEFNQLAQEKRGMFSHLLQNQTHTSLLS